MPVGPSPGTTPSIKSDSVAIAMDREHRPGVDIDELEHESHGNGVVAGKELRKGDVTCRPGDPRSSSVPLLTSP